MSDPQQYIQQFSKKNILVVGDVMLDEYINGEAERISPEAPIPVLLQKSVTHVLGGAANVAANVASLGANATLLGVVGKDSDATVLARLCKQKKILSQIIVDPKRPTTKKIRFVASGHQLVRIDKELTETIPSDIESRVIETIRKMRDQDIVIISDYAKGCITKKILDAVYKKFGANNVIADMKPVHASWYRGILAITPNLKETYDMTNIRATTDTEATRAAKILAKQLHTLVILTRGEHGITVCEDLKSSCSHFRSTVLSVKDVTGAGDTLIAVVTLMIAAGAPLLEAAAFANFAAGAVVGVAGTYALTRRELEDYVQLHEGKNVPVSNS